MGEFFDNNLPKTEENSADIVKIITVYRQEAWHAKRNRMYLNSQNFEMYHHRQDWRHKKSGQSREFLPKLSNAVEQMTYFMQQGLVDQKDWFSVERAPGVQDDLFTEDVIKKILGSQLKKNNIYNFIGDSIKMGALGSLMICKIYGEYKSSHKYMVNKDPESIQPDKLERVSKKRWQLKIDLVRQENYYPDPEPESNLYTIEDIPMDYHDLLRIAQENPDEYDIEAIKTLSEYRDFYDQARKSRENDQNITYENARRKRVLVTELWGTIVDQDGNVIMTDCICAMGNKTTLIRKPKKNSSWTGNRPYVSAPITRVPHSVWHRAAMDAAAALNQAENELFNLMLDGGMMSVHGIKQIREHWLDDPTQISDGIGPGDVLRTNTACPPGQKVLERIDTSAVPQDGMNMWNLLDHEFQSSALTSESRSGQISQRQVKATEIVASNQSINGIFGGMIKGVEEEYVAPTLSQSWLEIAQHLKEVDEDELKALLGEPTALKILSLSPQEIFARCANGNKFKVFGLSMTLNKMVDFKKIGALLQTISGSPELMAAFSQKYDISKLLIEIVKSLDIDEDKIEKSPDALTGQGVGASGGGPGSPSPQASPQPGQQPDVQSQIPQIAGMKAENGTEIPRSALLSGMTHPGG